MHPNYTLWGCVDTLLSHPDYTPQVCRQDRFFFDDPSAHAIFPKIVTRMRKDGDIPYIYYKTYIGVWSGYCIFYISPTFLINHISG